MICNYNNILKNSKTNVKPAIDLKPGERINLTKSDGTKTKLRIIYKTGDNNAELQNHFETEHMDGEPLHVNLEEEIWSRDEEPVNVFLNMVPREKWQEEECILAQKEELEKLKMWNVYDLVDDEGQTAINVRWVMWKKDNGETRARLVVKGYEETQEMEVDSPTVEKVGVRMLYITAQSYNWKIKSMDVKSAFLQGK